MFDFDVGKILVVAVVVLVVVGPKDLPRVLVSIARAIKVFRRAALQFRARAKEMIDDADLEGLKTEFAAIDRSATAGFAFDPRTAMRGCLPESAVALGDKASQTAPATVAVAGDAFSSPEMREYLSPSPPSTRSADHVSASDRGITKSDVARESAS
jgi:sec-independent protein translocase protein TatB